MDIDVSSQFCVSSRIHYFEVISKTGTFSCGGGACMFKMQFLMQITHVYSLARLKCCKIKFTPPHI